MTNRLCILLCVATFACIALGAARAATVQSASAWDPDATAPTMDGVFAAAARARATHCRTSSCHAIITIDELQNIDENQPKSAGTQLNRALLDHPERFRPVCAMGAKLFSRFHLGGDWFFWVVLLVNAVDVDLRDHGHCARAMASAVPREPGNDEMRTRARDLCVNGSENQHRPDAACAVLVEGVQSAAAWDPDATAPDSDDVEIAAARAHATHCRTKSCKAIVTINQLMEIDQVDEGVPTGEYIANWPQLAGRRLDRTLLDHPELFGPVCAMGVKLLSRVQPESDSYLVTRLLMNAVDIDLRGHRHCARDLLAALPRSPGNDKMRIDARDLCISEEENHHRPDHACAVLVEGVHEDTDDEWRLPGTATQ